MLQINASTSPLNRPHAAGDDESGQKPASADGFEALLAGLMGIAAPPFVPTGQARPITLAAADTAEPNADGEAAAGDALAETATAGDDGTRPSGEAVPGQGRAELPLTSRPEAGPPAVASGDAAADRALSNARLATGQQIPPRPGEPVVGDEAAGERSAHGRPFGEAAPNARPSGQGSSIEATRTEHLRPPVEPAARRPAGERPAALVEAIHQANAPPDTAAGRALPVTIQARPDLVDRPLLAGPLLVGGRPAFAPMALQVDWGAPADAPGSSGLAAAAALTGAAERAALVSAEPLTGSTTSAVRQLAVAIDRAASGELRHLTIQLSPKALGTIEIALEFDADRRLAVVILAERPETLELLRSEARELQRLLAQQGIDLADAGLELGLMGGERRQGQPSDGEQESSADGDGSAARSRDNPANGPEPPRLDLVGTPGRLNLSI